LTSGLASMWGEEKFVLNPLGKSYSIAASVTISVIGLGSKRRIKDLNWPEDPFVLRGAQYT